MYVGRVGAQVVSCDDLFSVCSSGCALFCFCLSVVVVIGLARHALKPRYTYRRHGYVCACIAAAVAGAYCLVIWRQRLADDIAVLNSNRDADAARHAILTWLQQQFGDPVRLATAYYTSAVAVSLQLLLVCGLVCWHGLARAKPTEASFQHHQYEELDFNE
jgi:hypothetical protein